MQKLLEQIKAALAEILATWGVEAVEIEFETPRQLELGDVATNVCFRLAKSLRRAPQQIATELAAQLDRQAFHLETVEAVAGYINFKFERAFLAQRLLPVLTDVAAFSAGSAKPGRILLEFVSANPTGYLHVGHGRGAVYGDSLARIMRRAGHDVACEFYVNDGGNQINLLANSIYERYKELFGLPFTLADDYYHGPEIKVIAQLIKEEAGDRYLLEPWFDFFKDYGVTYLTKQLAADLAAFNVHFDNWFREKALYETGAVAEIVRRLEATPYTYRENGALWFASSHFGDEKDRVLIKSDQSFTYLTPDIAYHCNKFDRGFTHLIDILGADHHGYVNRLKAALSCLGYDAKNLEIEILQMVRVIQNGEEIKMSKRSGKAISLSDLIAEVGVDALRFMYISKALSTHMDLDLTLAVSETNENPIYYVQYAYARIQSLFRNYALLGKKFQPVTAFREFPLAKLEALLVLLNKYPQVIAGASASRLPHLVAQYTIDLATLVHSFYNEEKIIGDNDRYTAEILTLLKISATILKDALALLGVGVKDKM